MNILFSCAGRRRYLLKYFREELSKEDKIIATDMQCSAPALTEADVVEIVPAVYAENYIEILKNICVKHHVSAIISLNDLELPILAQNLNIFEEIGTKVLVSSIDVIDTCFDKYKTAQFITDIGLNTPNTFIIYDNALGALKSGELKFPVIIKPRWGSGSIGIEIAHDFEDLEILYKLVKKKIRRSILSNASNCDECVLIQEFINGDEYGVDIINDLDGNYCGISVKKKLSMRAGETDKSITIKNKEINNIGKRIATKIKHISNLDCDILEKDGKYYVLELNPRFGGGYPFSHEAGVNIPKAIIAWLNGGVAPTECFNPIPNMAFAKCDILVKIN